MRISSKNWKPLIVEIYIMYINIEHCDDGWKFENWRRRRKKTFFDDEENNWRRKKKKKKEKKKKEEKKRKKKIWKLKIIIEIKIEKN